MSKAADIAGPITLTVLVKALVGRGPPEPPDSDVFWPSGVTGEQQGPVRRHSGNHRGDEEEPEPPSLREGALRGLHLQQLRPREHGPQGPGQLPALQGPSPRRGLR